MNAETPNKATGPKTDAGKARSRRNARRHGLTARLPDCEAEAAAMSEFAERWHFQLGSQTEAEEAVIKTAASAYARLERYRKVEQQTMRQSALNAVARWEQKQRHRVRAKAQSLETDPYNTVQDLLESSFGCEWLVRHWRKLDAKLAQGVLWVQKDVNQAMRLFGYLPDTPGPDADPHMRRVAWYGALVSGHKVPTASGREVPIVEARAALRQLIAEEVARLETLCDELWEEQDGIEAEAVANGGLQDTSKEGQLRRRYAKEASSEMTRGINQMMRIRIEYSRFMDRQWAQAHAEHRPARQKDRPIGPEDVSPCLRPKYRPEPDPQSSRNEPQNPAPEAAVSIPNPNTNNDIQPEAPTAADTLEKRSEPAPTAPITSSEPPIAVDPAGLNGLGSPSELPLSA